MNVYNISSFDQINIPDNSLILCDIDETVLKYKTHSDLSLYPTEYINSDWWKYKFEYYYDLHLNYDLAECQSYSDWINIINNTHPECTDYIGFGNLLTKLKETNSSIKFITARKSDIEEITINHLNKINNEKFEIIFCDNTPKGEIIKSDNHIFEGINHIIFIDDLINNIENVYSHFGDKITYYQFIGV